MFTVSVLEGWTWNASDVQQLINHLINVQEGFSYIINKLDISCSVINYLERKMVLDLYVYIRSWPSMLDTIFLAGADRAPREKDILHRLTVAYHEAHSIADVLTERVMRELATYARSNRPTHDHLDLLIAIFGGDMGREKYTKFMGMWWTHNPGS